MQKYLVDHRDLLFTLFEFLEVDKMNRFRRFENFDRAVYEETIRLAEKIAAESVFPANVTGHREGCHYDPQTKSVRLPSGYPAAAKALFDAGFLSISDDQEIGGAGMPLAIQACTWEIFCGAGGALMLFSCWGTGPPI